MIQKTYPEGRRSNPCRGETVENRNRKLGLKWNLKSKGRECRNIERKKVKAVNGWYSLENVPRFYPNFQFCLSFQGTCLFLHFIFNIFYSYLYLYLLYLRVLYSTLFPFALNFKRGCKKFRASLVLHNRFLFFKY